MDAITNIRSVPVKNFPQTNDLKLRVETTADIAAENADAVDSDARFPNEAFFAAKKQKLLGILVPSEYGGEDASVSDVVDICYMLGRSCASTAMVFAMHQIMVAILVRHAGGSAWLRDMLRRVASEQMLLASSTTDGQGGGDLRASACVVERTGPRLTLVKNAAVMSYGAHADGLLTTARRAPDALPSDQVMVAFGKEDYVLERKSGWNALGMRGTCSAGFMLKGEGGVGQILPDSYQKIHAQTMMPVAHLTWSGVWTGLAAGAVHRARKFIRASARQANGQLPPGAAHLTRANLSLRALRGIVASTLQRYETAAATPDELETLDCQNALNLLKVTASEMATATVMSALQACGLSGYRNDGEFSVSRHLRDVLSSSIMINNDRILANAAAASMLAETPSAIRD